MFERFEALGSGHPSREQIIEAFRLDGSVLWNSAVGAVHDTDDVALVRLWSALTKQMDDNKPIWQHLDLLAFRPIKGEDVVPYKAGSLALACAACAQIAFLFNPTNQEEAKKVAELEPIIGKLEDAFGCPRSTRNNLPAPGKSWPDYIRARLSKVAWSQMSAADVSAADVLSAAWVWDAICQVWTVKYKEWLSGLKVEHSCHVPIVGVNGTGFLATLVLERLNSTETPRDRAKAQDRDPVFHDPSQAFVTSVDQQFRTSMLGAWTRALDDVRDGMSVHVVGRWRLWEGWNRFGGGSTPVRCPQANGYSAGGAALRGWRFALTNTFPHDRVVVLAKFDADSPMGYVGLSEGLVPKVEHIARHDKDFDTIMVASEENAKEAVATLVAQKKAASSRAEATSGIQVLLVDHRGYQFADPNGESILLSPYRRLVTVAPVDPSLGSPRAALPSSSG